jgi:signal transduction histidine kinase
MTGHFFLDWAAMAVSLFNTILLLWLGLTVLLNAERRTWGLWLAGGGLLAGGGFFVSHSAILGHGSNFLGGGLNFWWHAGWGPVIALPLTWYLITLWYSGFWETGAAASGLRARQRPWFALALAVAVGLGGLVLFANPLPSFSQVARLRLTATPSLGGVPVLILAYPAYLVLCTSLSIDALRRPGPSGRVMGDLARRRARPWLVAAAGVLLAVSLLVAAFMLWVVEGARAQPAASLFPALALAVGWFDLAIAALIAVTVLLVGQAVAAYEVFTGRTLPRRGLLRQWRNAVILAAGYSLAAGWSLTIQLRPIYSLLLTALILAVFYALFGWRTYAEREAYIRGLRPFVASQHLYENLVTGATPPDADLAAPFRALCRDVLGTRGAYLAALGPLAPLVPPLGYPETGRRLPERWTDVAAQFASPQTLCLPLDTAGPGGGALAVPLWSERGLIGLLRLEAKSDGGPYAQEEIEIARASGERLIDLGASAEMARRLMELQRQRLIESQVLDRRARRVLHDDILPRLHAVMLALSAAEGGAAQEPLAQLGEAHRQIADLLRDMPGAANPDIARLGLFAALRRLVEDELGGDFAEVTWEVRPEAESAAEALPLVTAEVLFYAAREAMRNAARHGRRPGGGPVQLRVEAEARAGLQLAVADNGAEAGRGPGEDSKSGSGQGLALHSTLLAVVGGTLSAERPASGGRRITLALPAQALP